MALVVVRFDEPRRFVALQPPPDNGRAVSLTKEADGGMRLKCTRTTEGEVAWVVAIGLPQVGLSVDTGALCLEIAGDGGLAEVCIECADRRGWGLAYSLGRLKHDRRTDLSSTLHVPCEVWGDRLAYKDTRFVEPLVPHNLVFHCPPELEQLEVVLYKLYVEGTAQLVPAGLADHPGSSPGRLSSQA